MTDKELLQMALDALEKHIYEYETIQAIKARLAQPDCICGEPNSEGVHRKDKPCYVETEPTVDGWPLYSGLPQPEPVAHSVVEPLRPDEYQRRVLVKWVGQPVAGPLYTTPPKKEWVGLTDEEIDEINGSPMRLEHSSLIMFIRAIEAKLKEKNT